MLHGALVLALVAPVTAYSLLRKTPDAPDTPGLACIPVPIAKLIAPGQRATMHVYDASSLQVIRHAQANTDNTYGQVVINETAASERKFRLLDIGSRVKVLSVTPSTHTDKFGGTSSSLMAEVIGVGVIEPDQVLAKMPFMTVECADDDALLTPAENTAPEEAAAWETKLAEAAALCESLDGITSYKGPLSQATERAAGGWSLDDCIACALAERGDEEEASNGGRLQLSALAATAHLPGEWSVAGRWSVGASRSDHARIVHTGSCVPSRSYYSGPVYSRDRHSSPVCFDHLPVAQVRLASALWSSPSAARRRRW